MSGGYIGGIYGLDYGANKGPFFSFTPISELPLYRALLYSRIQGKYRLAYAVLEVGLHGIIKYRVRVRLHSIIFSYYICQRNG